MSATDGKGKPIGAMTSWTRAGLALALFALATAASGQVPDSATPNLLASPTPDLELPLKRIPLSSLKATRDRPLFTPSRRPPEVVVIAPPAEPAAPAPPPPPPDPSVPRPNLTLVGTVTTGKTSFAIFTDPATQDTIRLHMGEAREGWTLASIDRRAATLTNGDQAFTIEFPTNVEAPDAPASASDDDTPAPPAWQARHQAAADGETPLRPPPGSIAHVPPPPPQPTLKRRVPP